MDSFLSSSLRIATSSSVILFGSNTSAFVTFENEELGLVDSRSSNEEPGFILLPVETVTDWMERAGLAGGRGVAGEGGITTGEEGTGGRESGCDGGRFVAGTGALFSNCRGMIGICRLELCGEKF